jgi:hypothetical protein
MLLAHSDSFSPEHHPVPSAIIGRIGNAAEGLRPPKSREALVGWVANGGLDAARKIAMRKSAFKG